MPDPGRLIVCATPIGNLGDVTLRVLDALRSADTITAEDTRVTRKLTARYDIHVPIEPYHAHNLEKKTPKLVERIRGGETVALVSDAGTPGISDPGARLVDACLAAELPVDVLPGASAIVTALVASGLPTHAFYFGGFLPRKAGERSRRLESLAALDATLIFFESPHRTAGTLGAIAQVLPAREAAVTRELTKIYEEVARGPIDSLATQFAERELKGEVVIVVGPPDRESAPPIDTDDLRQQVETLIAEGMSRSSAVRHVAKESGVSRNLVYGVAHARDDA